MDNGNNSISSFLSTNPSVSQILDYVDKQAQDRVKQIKAGQVGQ